MIKKIICMLLCICMIFILCSCSDELDGRYVVKVYSGERYLGTYEAHSVTNHATDVVTIHTSDDTIIVYGGTVVVEEVV